MVQNTCTIVENKKIGNDFFMMRVVSPCLVRTAKAGQFVMVRCSDGRDPLLRRPLGIHRIFSDGIGMLYEVVGQGTRILSGKKSGETVDIMGPLGNGFKTVKSSGRMVIVSGGIGVAPLVALADELKRLRTKEIDVFIGARTKGHVLCERQFRALGARVIVSTDDGSKGRKGFITEALAKALQSADDAKADAIFACGPNGMLRAVWEIAKEHDVPCQLSFESHMACGVGVCLGCPIKVRTNLIDFTYKMVCKDGPVFRGEEIAW